MEKKAASLLDRTGDEHRATNPQECKEEKVEEFREPAQLGVHGEGQERLVSKQKIITELELEPEPEPEQETYVPSDCEEQEHRRELVPLDIPDFLLPDAAEDKNGG